MKKVLYSIVAVLLIVISSCQKDNNDAPTDSTSKTTDSWEQKQLSHYEVFHHIIIPMPFNTYIEIIGCDNTGGNCLPEVEIVGMHYSEYEKFKEAVLNETEDTYFLDDNYKTLFPDLTYYPNVITELKEGNSKIIMRKNEESSNDDLIYYIVCPKESISDSTNFEKAHQVVLRVRE